MNKYKIVIVLISTLLTISYTQATSAKPYQDQAHTAENALDWAGEYQGKINRNTHLTLTLDANHHYELAEQRLKNPPQVSKGMFSFDPKNGSLIHLSQQNKYKTFFVGENFVEVTPNRIWKSSKKQLKKVAEYTYLEVSPEKKMCSHGAGRLECLQVKAFNVDEQGKKIYLNQDWEYFYNQIEGYTHNPKKIETIKVKKVNVDNPPADASSLNYILQN